ARDIVASARMLREAFGGRVPDTMEQLLRLPGVGRKTANLILGDIYGQEMEVEPVRFLRPEAKFPSLEELKNQLARDAAHAAEVLKRGE
ncbi:riboflavin kinase, partial [Akkermansia sp.]|uniref:riboflavin kinase n=1 Tax=Akkermansia sp. TaxID=1872421 RepID=UPI003AAFA5B4